MAEVHVTIRPIDASDNQIVFHNPAQHPLPPSAGKAVTTTSGTHGTVNNAAANTPAIVFDNPA